MESIRDSMLWWRWNELKLGSIWKFYLRPRFTFPPLPLPLSTAAPLPFSLSSPRPLPARCRRDRGRRSLDMLLSDCEPESLQTETISSIISPSFLKNDGMALAKFLYWLPAAMSVFLFVAAMRRWRMWRRAGWAGRGTPLRKHISVVAQPSPTPTSSCSSSTDSVLLRTLRCCLPTGLPRFHPEERQFSLPSSKIWKKTNVIKNALRKMQLTLEEVL